MVFLDVGNVDVEANGVSTVNSETVESDKKSSDDTRKQRATNSRDFFETETLFALIEKLKYMKQDEIERNIEEWQLISRAMDRVLFVLNLMFVSVGFAYGYITVATH